MGPNRFSAIIFKFEKMYTSYNVALAEAGVPVHIPHVPVPHIPPADPVPIPTEPIVFTDADIATIVYEF